MNLQNIDMYNHVQVCFVAETALCLKKIYPVFGPTARLAEQVIETRNNDLQNNHGF